MLGGLLLRAIGRELPAVVLGIAYAVTDEVHQSSSAGRQGGVLDVLVTRSACSSGSTSSGRARAAGAMTDAVASTSMA